MDKKTSSEFGKVAREFVSAGGSLICLAHVYKHKGVDGKSIHAGTSDIKDDSDCTYIIERIGLTEGFCSKTYTVEYTSDKTRGDVAHKVLFEYTKEEGAGYINLFDSVKRLEGDAVKVVHRAAEDVSERKADAEMIQSIENAIRQGSGSKSGIQKAVGHSRRKVDSILEKYTDRLWNKSIGKHNKSEYTLNEAPKFPKEQVSFL